MAGPGIIIEGGLSEDDKVYRYITLSQFLSYIERKKRTYQR